MSVFYGVRLTDDLSARIEATGKGKTEVITAALEAYFGKPLLDVKVEKPQTGTAALMDGKRKTIKAKRETKASVPVIETPVGIEDDIPPEVVAMAKAKAVDDPSKCPHGYPSKRHCNYNSGGCLPW